MGGEGDRGASWLGGIRRDGDGSRGYPSLFAAHFSATAASPTPLTPYSDWFASSFTGCLKVSTYFIDCEKTYTLGNDTVNW